MRVNYKSYCVTFLKHQYLLLYRLEERGEFFRHATKKHCIRIVYKSMLHQHQHTKKDTKFSYMWIFCTEKFRINENFLRYTKIVQIIKIFFYILVLNFLYYKKIFYILQILQINFLFQIKHIVLIKHFVFTY